MCGSIIRNFLRLGGLLIIIIMFRMTLCDAARVPTNFLRQSCLPGAAFVVSSPSSPYTRVQSFKRIASRCFSATQDFFARGETFESIGVSSPILLSRITHMDYLDRPSAVQAAAYKAIAEGGNVTVGAETGSGKTLAYLLPLLDDILKRKQEAGDHVGYDYARAIILVPNKELVQQVVRMAVPLCGGHDALAYGGSGGQVSMSLPRSSTTNDLDKIMHDKTMVRLAIMPGGLKSPMDFQPFRQSIGLGGSRPPVDIVISTPAAIGPLALSPKHIDMFADISTLVIDEADMLLDGGYIRQLENALMGFRRADRLDSELVVKTQHVFVAATLPDMGLRSVDAYLLKKFPNATRVTMAGMHKARHYGLRDHTVWIEEDVNKERMARLVEMLQTPRDEGGLQNEKVMVFLNSADDVDGAHGALCRAGIQAVPYHAKIALSDRAENLDRFRRYSPEEDNNDSVAVLVCTDLASRGLDVPGVTAIVQLQFAGNVVAHLHRMGRCGRAGNCNGRGIVFYGQNERELVEVVRDAEMQQERMMLEGDVDEVGEESEVPKGSVKNAFSRRRGFTKKRKKLRKETEAV